MWEVARRLIVFTVFATGVAYAVFLMAGATIYAQESQHLRTVWVRDEVGPDIHRLSGSVAVPSSCHELRVFSEKLSERVYKLSLHTWEHPYVDCVDASVTVGFREVIFAPAAGITFIATLDGKPLPIIVTPVVE
jgi:hypothetical protein